MIQVDQTMYGHPDGNCFSACLASLLEVPIDFVPRCQQKPQYYWLDVYDTWLSHYGLGIICLSTDPYADAPTKLQCPVIAGGKGPRGFDHAVVWKGGRMIHDPHYDRTGLVGDPTDFYVIVVRKVSDVFAPMRKAVEA